MISTKEYLVLQVFFFIHLLYLSSALQCKSCEKSDSLCLLGSDVDTRDCPNEGDSCYSWFDRTRSDVGVQRGCISPETAEYKIIKQMLEEKDNACFKRANGLDCFKLCSNDKCN